MPTEALLSVRETSRSLHSDGQPTTATICQTTELTQAYRKLSFVISCRISPMKRRRAGKESLARVLRDVLATPVSPELLPAKDGEIAQKTEDIVGPYDLHDFYLYHFMRWGETPDKIMREAEAAFADEFDSETIKKWLNIFLRRFYTQQFKRSALPDGPKVGSAALSPRGDWRMPSDADGSEMKI